MKRLKLYLAHETVEGLAVKEDEKHIVIKLSSGYNMGILRHNIERIEELGDEQATMATPAKPHQGTQETSLPKVLILHTGGTIASRVDYKTGATVAQFEPGELTGMFPELKSIANIDSKLFRNMMSDDMRFVHYNLIAGEIESEIKKHHDLRGIIITHGTDTLHYTSAALSFIFEHLPIPVVLVGSQRSSDRGSSDSAINLISAVSFIANTSLKGVFICMHESTSDDNCIILNGINARKMHSSRRDAFEQINSRPIARVNFFTRDIEYISEYPDSALNSAGDLKLHLFDEKLRIGIIMSHPNMHAQELEVYAKGYDGLVLEGTGLGHMPISVIDEYTSEHQKIRKVLAEVCTKIPVVMSTQAISGRINMNVYSPGRELAQLGVIGNQSILCPESAFIKLAWLLSQKLDPKDYFLQDLRGEFLVKGLEQD